MKITHDEAMHDVSMGLPMNYTRIFMWPHLQRTHSLLQIWQQGTNILQRPTIVRKWDAEIGYGLTAEDEVYAMLQEMLNCWS